MPLLFDAFLGTQSVFLGNSVRYSNKNWYRGEVKTFEYPLGLELVRIGQNCQVLAARFHLEPILIHTIVKRF